MEKRDVKLEKFSNGAPSELIFVHIGKCGGATLRQAIDNSPVVRDRFRTLWRVHIRKPYYQKHSNYLLALRNPVSRAMSAFNWRHKLVVETREQEFRFTGEFEVLAKYGCLNNLAESLFHNEALELSVVKDWLTVHHLKEDIAFYLDELVGQLRRDQLFAVFVQETLNTDIQRLLGVENSMAAHEHRSRTDASMLCLSECARRNLKRFLSADYEAIRRISELYNFEPGVLNTLLQ